MIPDGGALTVTVAFRAQRWNIQRKGARLRIPLGEDVVRDPMAEFALGCIGIAVGQELAVYPRREILGFLSVTIFTEHPRQGFVAV
jgi:hypothetical protein